MSKQIKWIPTWIDYFVIFYL